MLGSSHLAAVTTVFLTLSLLLLPAASASSHDTRSAHRRHHARASDRTAAHSLTKRYDNARFTYYTDGQGACGWNNGPNDWVVALPPNLYANGAHCGKKITINANGKTAEAQVVDECPGCNNADLDLSEGLFKHFAPESQGVVHGSWNFN